MANSDSEKSATDRQHESYADDAKAQRVVIASSSGTVMQTTLGDSTDNIDGSEAIITASAMYGRITSGTVVPVELDDSTHTTTTIGHSHHEIHAGSHFFLKNHTDVGASGTFDMAFCVPAGNIEPHTFFNFSGEGEFTFNLYELPGGSAAGGTEVTVNNNNRRSSNTATATAFNDFGVDYGSGTVIWASKIGSGKKVGGETRQDSEIIGKASTDYVFNITNPTAGTLWLSWDIDWYEHSKKD